MFITVKQAAEKWGISDRRVRVLCSEGKIPGACRQGRGWRIPASAPKPPDGRSRTSDSILKIIDEKMPPEEELQDLAEFFKVFGDATRLKILYVLLSSEMCVYDIAAVLGMSQSAISHQLRVLKQMDLVKNRREGKTIFYSLADDHIVTILSQGLDHIEE